MATGRRGSISIGKQADFETAVPPTRFFNATEGIEESRDRLRESSVFGTRSKQGASAGRLHIKGGISGIHARAPILGDLLRATLGAPVTTGAGPYVHVFNPQINAFSEVAAVPPYSVDVKRKTGMTHRYAGGQLSKLTLRQPKDDALTIDTDWLFKSVSDVADPTLVLSSAPRFLFNQLAVQRDGVDFPYLESLNIMVDNALDPEEVLNESDEISAVEFGDNSSVDVEMTLTFRDSQIYQDFKTNTVKPWSFVWTIDADNILDIAVPQLNIESWSAPIKGPGRMTVSVKGTAEFNTVAGNELTATLTNSVATY